MLQQDSAECLKDIQIVKQEAYPLLSSGIDMWANNTQKLLSTRSTHLGYPKPGTVIWYDYLST